MRFIRYYIPLLLFPINTYAAPSDFKDFVYDILIGKLLNPATAIVVSLIILYFFYNSAIFLFKTDASAQEKSKITTSLMWSVIILFLLVTIWGIVKLVAGTLTLETSI